jgi:predicted RNA-binding Zn ribbon-like protein
MVVRDDEEVDLLADRDQLRRWLELEADRLGNCGFALAHAGKLMELREAIRATLAAAARGEPLPANAVRRLNAASRGAPVAPQLAADGAGHEAVRGDRLARLHGELARSAIALISGSERERLRICDAPSCGMFFVGARRWCCAACGNRARAARHYRRQAA